jgi:hypothetical protein
MKVMMSLNEERHAQAANAPSPSAGALFCQSKSLPMLTKERVFRLVAYQTSYLPKGATYYCKLCNGFRGIYASLPFVLEHH